MSAPETSSTPGEPAVKPTGLRGWRRFRAAPSGSIQGFLVGGLALVLAVIEGLHWLVWSDGSGASLLGSLVRMGLTLLVFAWLAGRALAPIRQLGDRLQGQASAVDDDASPRELQPVTEVVHRLLRQQRDAVDQQSRFLADASHQLRTPFAVLRTQLQGALSGQLEVRETLPKMLATVDRSSQLVRQLLSQAKVDQLVGNAHWQDVDLEAVAREVCLEFAPLLARKRLDFSLESVPVNLRTDPWLAGELLRNLMSNAIHHSAKGSAMGMVLRVLPGQSELLVWDHGGGIDETLRARLFEPFQSAAGGTGIGLGLSICRQIAQSMQAEVELFNRVQDGQVIGVDAVVRWPHAPVAVAGPVPAHPTVPLPVAWDRQP
ncbi:MAG: hypothetical protein A2W72_00350 [Burkholderiales bacterium RIFCSPLOWO2_12_67_14]|nr:MAG: hypothetical protein A2W72_00350 [Burkholderiales bacterium RIFCSPLOWO2_12_67_14]OGB99838.1 MAG: hypothetical protein A3G82_23390 [Burkholderiales bacterium RIFCSPLOWO2_12_FULL_67_210]